MPIMLVMKSDPELPEIVAALRPTRCLARLLYRRKNQSHRYRDDCDDDQQFDQSKPTKSRHTPAILNSSRQRHWHTYPHHSQTLADADFA